PDFLAVFPWTKQFPSGLSDHSMPQCADIPARDFEQIHIEESDIRRGFRRYLFHHLDGIGALNLIPENLSAAFINSGPLVPFRRCLVPASLQVVLHPI